MFVLASSLYGKSQRFFQSSLVVVVLRPNSNTFGQRNIKGRSARGNTMVGLINAQARLVLCICIIITTKIYSGSDSLIILKNKNINILWI